MRSEAFATLVESVALALQERQPSLEILAAVGLVWDWFERKVSKDPGFFTRAGRFRRPAALRAYVRQALWRAAANEARRMRRHPAHSFDEQDPFAPVTADAGDRSDVWAAMEKLPPDLRDLVVAIVIEGRSSADVAAELGVSAKTVARRFDRACDLLATYMS